MKHSKIKYDFINDHHHSKPLTPNPTKPQHTISTNKYWISYTSSYRYHVYGNSSPDQKQFVMPSLNEVDLQKILDALAPCLPKACAGVKLYVADNEHWADPGVQGGLAFYEDEAKETHFLKLINLETGTPVWEQEMYQKFLYLSPTRFFHTLGK